MGNPIETTCGSLFQLLEYVNGELQLEGGLLWCDGLLVNQMIDGDLLDGSTYRYSRYHRRHDPAKRFGNFLFFTTAFLRGSFTNFLSNTSAFYAAVVAGALAIVVSKYELYLVSKPESEVSANSQATLVTASISEKASSTLTFKCQLRQPKMY